MDARARAGCGTWVRACRGVCAGVTMSVWACGCPGVPAYGCASVCCFFSVHTCLSLTVPTTLTLVTARPDRIPSQTLPFFWGLFAHPSCAVEPPGVRLDTSGRKDI